MSDRMVDMADDEFYVEDETSEQIRAAIKRGEKGQTVGKKDLNRRARSVADRAVAILEDEPARVARHGGDITPPPN